jgi:hypothetical protein
MNILGLNLVDWPGGAGYHPGFPLGTASATPIPIVEDAGRVAGRPIPFAALAP